MAVKIFRELFETETVLKSIFLIRAYQEGLTTSGVVCIGARSGINSSEKREDY